MCYILQSIKLLWHVTSHKNWELIDINADTYKTTNRSLIFFQIVLAGTTWQGRAYLLIITHKINGKLIYVSEIK